MRSERESESMSNPYEKPEHLPEKGIPKAPRYILPTEEPFRLYVKDVARITGMHPITIRKWADDGLIPHIRQPNGWRRFRQSDAYRLAGFAPPPIVTQEEIVREREDRGSVSL